MASAYTLQKKLVVQLLAQSLIGVVPRFVPPLFERSNVSRRTEIGEIPAALLEDLRAFYAPAYALGQRIIRRASGPAARALNSSEADGEELGDNIHI